MKRVESRRSRKSASTRAQAAAALPGNLVAEIVDQITRKQARTEEPRPAPAGTCSFCLGEAVAGSSYRVVLKCGTGENPVSDT